MKTAARSPFSAKARDTGISRANSAGWNVAGRRLTKMMFQAAAGSSRRPQLSTYCSSVAIIEIEGSLHAQHLTVRQVRSRRMCPRDSQAVRATSISHVMNHVAQPIASVSSQRLQQESQNLARDSVGSPMVFRIGKRAEKTIRLLTPVLQVRLRSTKVQTLRASVEESSSGENRSLSGFLSYIAQQPVERGAIKQTTTGNHSVNSTCC
jgi:hypothetical protein